MQEEQILELMKRNNGAVIQYKIKNIAIEDSGDERQVETYRTVLMWTKIISTYWNNYAILLFSPIVDECIQKYDCKPSYKLIALAKYNNKVFKLKNLIIIEKAKKRNRKNLVQAKSLKAENLNDKETITSSIEQTEIIMQASKNIRKTPNIIKKLTIGLIFFFTIVLTIIFVEASLHHKGIVNTWDWFHLNKFHGMRHTLLIYLASNPIIYDIYRKRESISHLKSHCARTKVKIDRIHDFNILTRNYLEKLHLMYDYDLVMTTRRGESYPTSFMDAMIMYLKEVDTYTSIDAEVAKECIQDNSNHLCSIIDYSLQYCSDNGLYFMIVHQDDSSKNMVKELIDNNRRNKSYQYIFISACIAVILIFVTAVSILIVIVIKDKNVVLSIFAEVTKEEIDKAIKYAHIPIKTARFNMEHIKNSKGNEEEYWNTVIGKYKLNRLFEKKELEDSRLTFDLNEKPELESVLESEEEKWKRKQSFHKTE